jgi:chitodextrinase
MASGLLEGQAGIGYVQTNSAVPQTLQASVSVSFTASQTAGNLNLVVAGWNDAAAHVQSVSDSQGNAYSLAVGPTVRAGFASQAIYYAKNVKPGANTVTVTFDQAASFPDVRIAEYRGLDPVNPLDVVAAAQGVSTSANSGTVSTTNANDLLVGANIVSTLTSGPGASYTARVITAPDGDILEDRVVSATGSYSAVAPLSSSGQWIMQLVAFRTAGSSTDIQAPSAPGSLTALAASATQVNLSWTASTDNVGVTGYRVERCLGASCTTFAQVGSSTTITYSDTTVAASSSYNYRVRATDAPGNLSAYSNIATVTTPASPDTQAPTAPSGLIATAVSPTQINLSWSTSTDNVGVTIYLIERCQGATCSTFAQIGTTTALTYNDSGLTSSTTYRYRVRAGDAAGNRSAYSNIASAVTLSVPDTQPPTAPSNLGASAASTTQIILTWGASTDNVGVTGYRIERCTGASCSSFGQVGTAAVTSYTDSGLGAGTAYSYRVLATDAAGNLSVYSNTASATTPTPDSQPPSAPANLTATAVSDSQINLSWTASTDDVGVTSYLIERCQGTGCTTFTQIGAAVGTTFSNTGLAGSTTYGYRVRATDAALNTSGYSNTATATTQTTPSVAFVQRNFAVPQSPQAIVTLPFTIAQSSGNLNVVVVAWSSSSGQVVSVTDTRGNLYTRAVGPTVVNGFATQSIYYAANIAAAAANANAVTVTFDTPAPFPDIRIAEYTGIAGVLPVDAVVAASGNSTTSNSGTLTTTNPVDLLVGANIVSSLTTAPGTSFSNRIITTPNGDILEDRTVTSVGSYSATASMASGAWIMQLVAFKAGTNLPDTQPPTAPSGLSASVVSESQINGTWLASSDNVGVSAYLLERCQGAGCVTFVQIASLGGTATTFTDTGLLPSTSYTYRVRASDSAGNLSAYSNTLTTTTLAPDTEPPTVPGTLVATTVSGTQINVSWGPATDNVGVAGYRLERCEGTGCTAFNKLGTTIAGTSFSDTSLNTSTTYNYIVRAQDAAGNLGPYSNVATATTASTNPQLVAAYSFDEGAGTTITDLSGHSNNGTVTNGVWVATGKFGKAVSFNGINALVTIPDAPSLHLSTSMSLEAWVNPSVANFGWKDVIYKGTDNYYLEGATPGGVPAAGMTLGTSHPEILGTAQLPPNTWTFLAATYDGSALRVFVNGTQVASQAASGTLVSSGNPLQIGGDSIWGQFFQGLIDEVRVYSVALTPAQIQADMATAVGGSQPVASLAPTSVNFGNQPVGTLSAPVGVNLTNAGTVPLVVSSITVSGGQATEFTQTNNCVGALAPGATCGINVTFTPTSGGTRSGAISISDNAPGNPHSVSLTGTGTGFSIAPQTVVLTPIKTAQFTVTGAGTSAVVWSVDGVPGGVAATGTVNGTGLYAPPSTTGTHTVTVATVDGTKSASATVYVTVHAGVLTHHNDNARTGQNLGETVLTLSNVNSTRFGKVASYTIDGIAHASPLYLPNVNVPGVGLRNVVYVATEHDSVYAFDADGAGGNPLWKVSFINPSAGVTTVPNGDTGECCDIAPEIGITGTPVIDAAAGTLYVVAKTKEGPSTYVQRLHALDVSTGTEKLGGPVVIQASVPGTGNGSVGGTLSFNQLRENQRTALLLYNGVVYMGFGSHGDNQPYHGWLLGYNATTLQRVLVFSSTPNGEGGGIWQSGGGLAIDSVGNFYFATGDGSYTINTGGIDYGDTFLRFNPASGVVDYFTPHDQATLNASNLDLDAGGMILLPDQPGAHPHLLVSAGKNGSIYLVDRDNMGHFNGTDRNVQTLVNIFPFGTPLPGNYSSPVYFNGAVYFGPVADVAQMFRLTNGLVSTAPTSTTPQTFAYPGAALSISANGTSNGILWATQKNPAGGGTLHAYDASNIAFELYSSDQAGTRDALDSAAKFSIPVVVNGRVFVATEGRLTVFGLLP